MRPSAVLSIFCLLLVDKWIKASGIRPRTATALTQVLTESRDQAGKLTTLTTTQVADALAAWITAAQALDADKQAAAYLIADRVLHVAWAPYLFSGSGQQGARNQLKKVGALSEQSTSGDIDYNSSWLQDAVTRDPKGPWGQRAELIQLEGDCAGGESPNAYHSLSQRALAVDSTSRLSKGARIALNRLSAGQNPDHVRFFCFGS
jgi:hypothetical protein